MCIRDSTAGAYSRSARAALREIAVREHLPIVTGGTGLYLRALTEGLFAGPARQEDLRARLRRSVERHGDDWLHRLLRKLDAATAERIHANDTPKLIRAIEVCLAARRPMSTILDNGAVARDPLTGFKLLRIGLNPPREALYMRLNQRCAAMFAAGLVKETRELLERYGPVKALDSLGYRQACAVPVSYTHLDVYKRQIHVPAQDGVHPDRGTLAQHYVAKDLRRNVDVATGGDLGRVPPIGSDHEGLLGDLS